MAEVKIFWDPTGISLDSLGNKKFLEATDGDTPYISVSIRMLSIDAPEVHYPGTAKPSRQDEPLAELAHWLERGLAPCGDALAAYLHPRLATGQAGTLQEHQGKQAGAVFEEMLSRMLARPNGSKRTLFVRTSNEPFDQYGRVLAYISPTYSRTELEDLNRWERASFNLLMVRSGWAVSFIIYPSLPKYDDLIMFQQAGKEAYLAGRGVWADSLTLSGYEFRMVVKLYKVTKRMVEGEKLSESERTGWIERYPVDLTAREIYMPEDYIKIAPYNRLFIWPKDVNDAVGRLNLIPAGR